MWALTGYVVHGCVEDGTWILWGNSSVVAAVLCHSFLKNFSEKSSWLVTFHGKLVSGDIYVEECRVCSKNEFSPKVVHPVAQCLYCCLDIHMSSTNHHILSISDFCINFDLNVHPSQKAGKSTFEKWVLHDFTHKRYTYGCLSTMLTFDFASVCLATLISQALSGQTYSLYWFYIDP